MKVVILCGGKGTRIRDVDETLPKPMLPIGGVPIVQHIMGVYGAFGHEDFVLCLGHLGWRLRQYFLDLHASLSDVEIDFARGGAVHVLDPGRLPPWRVRLAETGAEAMTGARLAKVRRHVGDSTFLLTYGDGLADVDLDALLAFHRAHGRLATITSVRPPSRFGELELAGGRVASFQEKPQAAAGTINGGFFVLEPGVFDYVTADDDCVFEREPLQRLAADGQLMAFRHEGFWMPMDTPREYQRLNELWASGDAPWAPARLRAGRTVAIPRPQRDPAPVGAHG